MVCNENLRYEYLTLKNSKKENRFMILDTDLRIVSFGKIS